MPTLKNEGNLNNEIGLPLTVLRLRSGHRAAVLEMGMYVGGEIADLARIGRPEIGVVTAVQPVHLSRIGTIEAVERAKGELVEALPGRRRRDPQRRRRAGPADGVADARAVVTYGFAADADVRAERSSRGRDGMTFELVAAGDGDRSRSRRSAGSPSTTRWRARPAGSAPACASTRSSTRSRRLERAARGQLVRRAA
jgi:UDP-N-acetylmuramyl pentapeptide synthase